MCVVIVKPTGSTVDVDDLRQCWYSNPQGAGIAWAEKGKLYIEKGIMEWGVFKEFWEARDWTDVSAIIHFRIATHGKVDEDNTHPFWVFPGQLAFAHNGMMDFEKESQTISDTQVFNRYILKQLPRNFLSNSGIRVMMEDFIGSGNKLAFIDKDGEISIVNEESGMWESNGCWFSNEHWKPCMLVGVGRNKYNNDPWDEDTLTQEERDWYRMTDDELDGRSDWERFKDSDTNFDEFIPYTQGLPPFLSFDVFYCMSCRDSFPWMEADMWYKKDGEFCPECPICMQPDAVFGIGENGMKVDGEFIPGRVDKDEVDDYLAIYSEEGGE